MTKADPFPLHHIDAHGGRVQQQVDHMVVEQVDLINVQQAAVGCRQDARFEMLFSRLDRPFYIQCSNDPIFCGAYGEIDE